MGNTSDVRQHPVERMLAGIPMRERKLRIAGVQTSVLEGGTGRPMMLLHGPGEFGAAWLPVLAELIRTNRLIVPDLPGHGASALPSSAMDTEWVLRWLGELIEATCPTPPVLVGRVVGGAIAARFAADHGGRLDCLVLVDALGLTTFEPAPRFGLAMHRFLAQPDDLTYQRFMEFCAFDLDRARAQLGPAWGAYASYAVALARTPSVQGAMAALIENFAATPIPPSKLAGIDVPTALIWGRHDLATPLLVAETSSKRYGWPLHVIEDAGDDPPLDQPQAFLQALRAAANAGTAAAVS